MQVRAVRKQVVKKALGLMERIDNVKAGMLRSLLDITHPQEQLESRSSLLESRVSQLETKSSQLESALGQPNKAGPAAQDDQVQGSAEELTLGQQRATESLPSCETSRSWHQYDDMPSGAAIAKTQSSPPAVSPSAATSELEDTTRAQLRSGASTSEQPESGASIGEQHGDLAQQGLDASGSHQDHDAVIEAERADIYSVAAAFAGAATPAQTDSERKQLQDREEEVEEEVTRQIFSALQQQGRQLAAHHLDTDHACNCVVPALVG